jgi:hypothetical protein
MVTGSGRLGPLSDYTAILILKIMLGMFHHIAGARNEADPQIETLQVNLS